MLFLKLALLNIGKYRRRSTIIVLSVVVSVLVVVIVGGMLDGLRASFFTDLLQDSGHLQIHDTGWTDRLDPYSTRYLVADPERVIDDLTRDPRVTADLVTAEPILQFGALLVNGEKNVAMGGIGVLPQTTFYERVRSHMTAGTFLPSDATASDGRTTQNGAAALDGSPTDGPGIAVSAATARLLGVGLGDRLVVLVQDNSGSPYYLSYPVTGLYDSGVPETDDNAFFISLADARELLDLANRATEIRVTLASPDDAEAVAAVIAPTLASLGLAAQTWREINGSLIVFIDLGNLFTLVINLFIIIVAATVITNSILMTVFERIPTFGTLRAIGLKRRQLFAMIVDEGAMLGLLGAAIGLAVGVPVVLYFQKHGLNVGPLADVLGTGTTYYFALTLKNALSGLVAGVLIAVVGSLYAATVSTHTKMIAALQQQGV